METQTPQIIRKYDDEGCLVAEWFEINNKKHGIMKEYFGSYYEDIVGKLAYETNFINGIQHGEFKAYWWNGNIHQIYNYVNGKRFGEYKMYNENGNLIKKEYYINDIVKE
jgi:antitoxin component YwqK of YwqJK toxin-antitoxin module